jgi:feruloyl esterase
VDVRGQLQRAPRFLLGFMLNRKMLGAPLAVLTAGLFASITFSPASVAAVDCGTLRNLALRDTTITSATVIPAAGFLPEYCRVLATSHNLPQSPILFEVALPTTKWNGKYFFAGGGGFNGTIPRLDQALAEGYAAAGSDTGHEGDSLDGTWALNNLQAQTNYGYLATHVVTLLGKEILRAYYAQTERRSYFVGCSNGGKMALMEAERYPDDFDGAIAGDPVIDRTKLMMSYTWNAQALAQAPIPPSKIPAIENATLAACRESGGVIAGVITTPARCKFDPKTVLCTSGDTPNCLTSGQVKALQKILDGPTNSAGVHLYPGFPPGHEDDYPSFITGNGAKDSFPSSQWKFQDQFMRYFVFGLNFDPVKQFNYGTHLANLMRFAGGQDAANPALSAFKAHGGKMILYHGWADHSITPIRTIEYYAEVIKAMGQRGGDDDTESADKVTQFLRLFMVPAMHHCGNGPGPNSFGGTNQGFPQKFDGQHDIVMALDQWVERGAAPEKITASHLTNGVVDRSLPLCPYPQVAAYNGSGDVKVAESYHCEKRSFRWALEGFQGRKN